MGPNSVSTCYYLFQNRAVQFLNFCMIIIIKVISKKYKIKTITNERKVK